jgi:hypothetical protein
VPLAASLWAALGLGGCAAESDDAGATAGTTDASSSDGSTTATSSGGSSGASTSGSSGSPTGGSSGSTGSSATATDSASTSAGTTSSTTTSATGTTAATSDTGCSFVCEPDGGPENECDPTAQDCPMDQKCTAWANDGGTFWNANKCVDVTGTSEPGDPCMVNGSGVSGDDDCAVGSICLFSDEMGVGQCVQFCAGAALTCGPNSVCAIYNDGVLPLCLPGCDPLLQDCPQGQSCIDTPNGTFICFTDASGTAGADGDVCPATDGENSCDPGQYCGAGTADCADAKCCTPYCDLGEPDPCIAPEECVSFYGDPTTAPPQFRDVGVCILP